MYTTDYGGTMTTADDTFARLAAANPVPELPAAEPPERLRRLIESEGHAVGGARRRTPTDRLMRPLAAVGAAMVAATVGLVLSNGVANPGVNIAAAAYAATAAGGDVVEAQFVERTRLPHGRVVRYDHREWLDVAAETRRDRTILPASLTARALLNSRNRKASGTIMELATSPHWLETWSSSEADVVRRIPSSSREREADVVRRILSSSSKRLTNAPQPAAGAGGGQAPAGIEAFRRLYREQPIKLIGHERWHGRLLWKLEGYVGFARTSAHAKLVPILAEVVLVDPRTYLPVLQRQILLPTRGRHVEGEDELVSYRHLPLGASSKALLKVTNQHPYVRVFVERPAKLGHVRPPKLPGRAAAPRPDARVFVERPAKLGRATKP
jgi:hypothetical protein